MSLYVSLGLAAGCLASIGFIGSLWLILDAYRLFHRTNRDIESSVRISPELMQEWRDEVIFNAVKRPHAVRADFQRGNQE